MQLFIKMWCKPIVLEDQLIEEQLQLVAAAAAQAQ